MIEVSELTKYYGERKGVGPMSFCIESGEVIGLLGLNGAGKTTTLRVLSSDLLPTSGQVLIDGVDLIQDPEQVRPKIGYLPERPPLYEEMQVREYLQFAARLRGVKAVDLQRRVDQAVEHTELDRESQSAIGSLSHGYRQRVGIAQAIVHSPKLLLLDEPTSGLDPVQIVEMRELVRSLRGEHTIVISSHNLPEISETCDRLLIIRDGQIVASGSEDELATRLAGSHLTEVTVQATTMPAGYREAADPLEGVEQLLGALDGVQAVRQLPSEEHGEDIGTFQLEAQRDVRVPLCQALVEAGVGILQLSGAPQELEDVFLHLTGSPDEADKAVAGERLRGKKTKGRGAARKRDKDKEEA